MTIAAVDYNGPTYPNIMEAAVVYGKYINAHGGINGHPLEVTTCDEKGDPNVLAACGRTAVADHDVAVVGSFTLNGNSIVPILQAANIPWFGLCCAVTTDEYNSPDSFPLGSGEAYTLGGGLEAWRLGCRKIALVALQGFQTETEQVVNDGLKAVGGHLAKVVTIPVTAQDYSPEVAEATTGTDCIFADISDTNWFSFLPAFQQSGATQRLFGVQGNLDDKVIKAFPQATQNAVAICVYPDLTSAPFATFDAALKTYNAPTSLDYNSLAGLGTWAAYVAFTNIVKTMTGPITGPTFLAAASKASAVSTGGETPTVNFTQEFTGLKGFPRLFNRSITFEIAKAGKFVPLTNNQFEDVTAAFEGKALPASS